MNLVGDLFNLVVKFPGNVCEPTRHIVLAFEAEYACR
jgi:hypothetical protein